MALTLYVDEARWRADQRALLESMPGLVPVVKGNGYGFGRSLLGAESASLGVPAVAVGRSAEEVDLRAGGYQGDVLVLEPLLAADDAVAGGTLGATDEVAVDDRVVRTAASLPALRELAGRRVVVELLSSVRRFGFTPDELPAAVQAVRDVRLEGVALHLPLDVVAPAHVAEVTAAVARARAAGLAVERLWLSHVSPGDLARLAGELTDVELRPRVGTALWLGDRSALQARAMVLATHPVRRGERYGYRQRRAARDGTLVVVSGGTSHGIALSAPAAAYGVSQRAKSVALGGLEAVGRSLSPFSVGGARRWFAEPPHMQVSMLWLPSVEPAPAVGSELDVDVRMTTTTFDRVVLG